MFQKELDRELKRFSTGNPAAARMTKVPEEQGSIPSRKRQLEWLESRRLEAEVREDLSSQGVREESWVTSVSHTRSVEGNWVVVIGSDQRVGVDLEDSRRKIKPGVASRIISESESQVQLKVWEFWVAKEAAFKANPRSADTFLSQYRVVGWDAKTQTGEILFAGASLPSSCQFTLLFFDPWLIAVARVK